MLQLKKNTLISQQELNDLIKGVEAQDGIGQGQEAVKVGEEIITEAA